jgi:hypothetical protein
MRRKHAIGIALFLVITSGWALLYRSDPHPSDRALIDYFHSHKLDFDRLVSMANEDSSVRAIYPDQVILEGYRIWPDCGGVHEAAVERVSRNILKAKQVWH